ncbi:uncharacterized protein PSFLO_02227 [Pseudozyma flocculosa]|uniref:Uncharacterized protein n=1 Tax=Pseudozyma flocculosa TaxID=84751 RepID=A0A5C3EYM6_9BASI|nr:uncharacterized protein PSFLO_02227 [Pseudozyma flocculosa]
MNEPNTRSSSLLPLWEGRHPNPTYPRPLPIRPAATAFLSRQANSTALLCGKLFLGPRSSPTAFDLLLKNGAVPNDVDTNNTIDRPTPFAAWPKRRAQTMPGTSQPVRCPLKIGSGADHPSIPRRRRSNPLALQAASESRSTTLRADRPRSERQDDGDGWTVRGDAGTSPSVAVMRNGASKGHPRVAWHTRNAYFSSGRLPDPSRPKAMQPRHAACQERSLRVGLAESKAIPFQTGRQRANKQQTRTASHPNTSRATGPPRNTTAVRRRSQARTRAKASQAKRQRAKSE